jgi:hypothetical protein
MTTDVIDTTSFGSTWKKSDRGMIGWEGTATGYLDKNDTSGQVAIETAFLNGTKLTGMKFYIDSTTYYAADPSSSSAGVYFTFFYLGPG